MFSNDILVGVKKEKKMEKMNPKKIEDDARTIITQVDQAIEDLRQAQLALLNMRLKRIRAIAKKIHLEAIPEN